MTLFAFAFVVAIDSSMLFILATLMIVLLVLLVMLLVVVGIVMFSTFVFMFKFKSGPYCFHVVVTHVGGNALVVLIDLDVLRVAIHLVMLSVPFL